MNNIRAEVDCLISSGVEPGEASEIVISGILAKDEVGKKNLLAIVERQQAECSRLRNALAEKFVLVTGGLISTSIAQ